MLLFKPGQHNALLHRAAQEVICGHKWDAADTGLDGLQKTDRQMDGCYPPNLGETPKPLTHHWTLPCIKTCLWFRLCDFTTTTTEQGRKHSKCFLMGGRNGTLFECGISAVLWRQSAWRDPCAKSVALHIKPSRKKTPNPSCKHWSMARWWKSHSCNTLVLLILSSCLVTLVSKRKNMKVITWMSLFLREKLYLIP